MNCKCDMIFPVMPAGRPRKINSPEDMEAAAAKYFLACETENKPFTITGLALALGLSGRDSLAEYGKRKEFTDTVKKIKSRCEHYCELQLFGKNPVGAIFALKNYGWKDKSEVEHLGTIKTILLPPAHREALPRPDREPEFLEDGE